MARNRLSHWNVITLWSTMIKKGQGAGLKVGTQTLSHLDAFRDLLMHANVKQTRRRIRGRAALQLVCTDIRMIDWYSISRQATTHEMLLVAGYSASTSFPAENPHYHWWSPCSPFNCRTKFLFLSGKWVIPVPLEVLRGAIRMLKKKIFIHYNVLPGDSDSERFSIPEAIVIC